MPLRRTNAGRRFPTDVRVVVASVDTFLRFAEATNRLDLYSVTARSRPAPTAARDHRAWASRRREEKDRRSSGLGAGDRRTRPVAQTLIVTRPAGCAE